MKGEWLTRSSSETDVRSRIARANYPASRTGDGTRGLGIAALGGLEGVFHFSRGGGERLRIVPHANSSLSGLFGASVVAAAFHLHLRAMRDTNSALYVLIGAPLVAAAFHLLLRAMPDTNSALNGSIVTPLVAASSFAHGCQLIRGVDDDAALLPGCSQPMSKLLQSRHMIEK